MAQYYSPEPQQTSALKHWQVTSVSFFAELQKRPEANDVCLDECEQVKRHLSPLRFMS